MNVPATPDLTDRQWEVVELVGGEGLSYKRAALRLGISYATVRFHAVQARDRAGLDTDPFRALILLWLHHNGRPEAA